MTRRFVLAAVAALTAVTASIGVSAGVATAATTAPAPPPPGLGIRLLDAPEDRRDDPRARTTVVDHVAPGTTFRRAVEASNGTDEPMRVRFYARPASLQDGDFVIEEEGAGLVPEVVTITPEETVIPPGGRVRAVAEFDVPAATPEDEYYGILLVERPAGSGAGIQVAARAGIAVYLSVGPGGEPASDFSIATLTAAREEDGSPVVVASVRNDGARALSISGELRLTDGPGGLSAGPFAATLGTVLGLGQTAEVRLPLDERLPDGPWLATLVLRSGAVERKAEGTITFPASAGEQATAVLAKNLPLREDPNILVPIAAGLLALLALLLLMTGLVTSRRRARLTAAQ